MSKTYDNPEQHIILSGLRAVIISTGLWAVSLSLTVPAGSVAAVIGCIVGCAAIDMGSRRAPWRLMRTSLLLLLFWLVTGVGILAADLMVDTGWLARLMSPIGAFNSGEFLHWLSVSLGLTASMRLLALRTGYGAILEIVLVAAAFVVTVVAHRHGMIHRPFFLGDYALIHGIDPSDILMAMGVGVVLALSALLMVENNRNRLPWHFAVLGMLCLGFIAFIRLFGLPTPSLAESMPPAGLEASAANRENDSPFKDGDNTPQSKQFPVAVVVFRDDYEPLNGSYYFRESARSRFNGSLLVASHRSDMDRDLIGEFPVSTSEPEILPGAAEQRSMVRTSVGLLARNAGPFGLVSPVAFENTPNPNNLRFKRTYDVYSMAPNYDFEYLLGRETGRDDWSDGVWDEYLTLPDDPRYRELAESLVGGLLPEYADDPFARAWSVKNYLDENGIYSLENEHAYAADPAASFLFGDLTGYCVHFAFAATYLFRSLGIPARVGEGFAVPAANRAGGSALIIQSMHGHAWPEIYFKDIGWVIVDPSPQRTLVDMSSEPQHELQQLLGDMLRDDSSFQDFLAEQRSGAFDWQLVMNAIYALLLAGLLMGYGIKLYRLYLPGFARLENQNAACYRALLDRLAAVGLIRDYGESRESFARRISARVPSMVAATDVHLAVALNAAQPVGFEPKTWQTLNNNMSAEISGSTAGWRRTLGLLNPFSWVFTR